MLEENKLFLHNCDNMEFMAKIPDKYFELAIVDPEYGIGVAKNGYSTAGDGGKKQLVNRKKHTPKQWDSKPAPIRYFKELKRISKNQIIWGANHFIENIPNANSSSWIVWNKENGDFSTTDCELAWTSFDTAVRMFTFRWSGMLQGDMKNKEIRIHPTQKPIALYKWLLSKYAKQGDKIFDSHLGSMSSVIAAYEMGFEIHGCELDKEYFDAGVKRVTNVLRQLKLF